MRRYSPASFRELLEIDGRFGLQIVCDRRYDLAKSIDPGCDYAGDIVAVFTKPG